MIRKTLFFFLVLLLFSIVINPYTKQNYKINLDHPKYEVVKLEFKDGFVHYMTSLQKYKICLSVRRLKKILETMGREIKDIKTFTHNHLECNKFSKKDLMFFSDLRRYGFRGEFLLYYKGNIVQRR